MGRLHQHALTLRQRFYRDHDGLARHLADICPTHPGLTEEVFSGMDEPVAAIVRQRFYANLSPAVNMYSSSTMVVWPPSTHSSIVKEAFDKLSDENVIAIQRGSARVDHESLSVPTLLEANAPQHAMTPKKKVVEWKSEEKAREWAVAAAKKFVSDNLRKAKNEYAKAIEGSKDGLVY